MSAALAETWAKPHDLSGIDLAIRGAALEHMPSRFDIPDEFRGSFNTWREFQADWFFSGLKGAEFTARAGVDQHAALKHLAMIQGSFEPKHEHKEEAVAYLASLWFTSVTVNGKTYGETPNRGGTR